MPWELPTTIWRSSTAPAAGFQSPSPSEPTIRWSLAQVRKTRDVLRKKGFPVDYKEIFNHTHNYYEISATINDDVWHFLEGYRLP